MTLFTVSAIKHYLNEGSSYKLYRKIKWAQLIRFLHLKESLKNEPKNLPERKIVKVAITGRPNAGKSTIINKIFNLNLCGASSKSHTTTTPMSVAFTHENTQIVFVDTPGVVKKEEMRRFRLPKEFEKWKDQVLSECDLIGLVDDITSPENPLNLYSKLITNFNELVASDRLFIIFNKVDLVLKKEDLNKTTETDVLQMKLKKFIKNKKRIFDCSSKIFFTSALNDVGVEEVVDFLQKKAKPGNWLFKTDEFFKKPLHKLVEDKLRAQILNRLPHEVPYQCDYRVEYLEENELGELVCVVLIICSKGRYYSKLSKMKVFLFTTAQQLESDLYKILGKVFRMKIVVTMNTD